MKSLHVAYLIASLMASSLLQAAQRPETAFRGDAFGLFVLETKQQGKRGTKRVYAFIHAQATLSDIGSAAKTLWGELTGIQRFSSDGKMQRISLKLGVKKGRGGDRIDFKGGLHPATLFPGEQDLKKNRDWLPTMKLLKNKQFTPAGSYVFYDRKFHRGEAFFGLQNKKNGGLKEEKKGPSLKLNGDYNNSKGDSRFVLLCMEKKDEDEDDGYVFAEGGVLLGEIEKFMKAHKASVLKYFDKSRQLQALSLDKKKEKLSDQGWFNKDRLHPTTLFADQGALTANEEVWKALAFSDRYGLAVAHYKRLKHRSFSLLDRLELENTYVITTKSQKTWRVALGSPRDTRPDLYLKDDDSFVFLDLFETDQSGKDRIKGCVFIQGGVLLADIERFMTGKGLSAFGYWPRRVTSPHILGKDYLNGNRQKLSDQRWFPNLNVNTKFANAAALRNEVPKLLASHIMPAFSFEDAFVITNAAPQKAQTWADFNPPAVMLQPVLPTDREKGIGAPKPNKNINSSSPPGGGGGKDVGIGGIPHELQVVTNDLRGTMAARKQNQNRENALKSDNLNNNKRDNGNGGIRQKRDETNGANVDNELSSNTRERNIWEIAGYGFMVALVVGAAYGTLKFFVNKKADKRARLRKKDKRRAAQPISV